MYKIETAILTFPDSMSWAKILHMWCYTCMASQNSISCKQLRMKYWVTCNGSQQEDGLSPGAPDHCVHHCLLLPGLMHGPAVRLYTVQVEDNGAVHCEY